jgi:hypothetical protein
LARQYIAYKYDDDLRHSILSIFDEAQVFPSARGRAGRSRGLLTSAEREGYRVLCSPCSLYRCELCVSTSPTHNCPFEPGGVPQFCRLCGSPSAGHDCPAQRRAEAAALLQAQRRLEAEERRQGVEQRWQEAEVRRAAQKAQREVLRQLQAEEDRKQAELAAKLREQRKELREAQRLQRAATAAALNEARFKPLPPPLFCPECGSSEKKHECRAAARVAAITQYTRAVAKKKTKRYARQRAKQLEAMKVEPDTLPTAAE